jgi:MFS family permease
MMSPEPMSHADKIGIGAAILLVALVGVGLSLSVPLLSLEMESMGISGHGIGLNTAIAGLSAIITVPFVPGLAARFGVGRVIGVSIAVTALAFLAFKAVFDYRAWFAIRFVFSAGLGTLFVLSEYWIAAKAPAAKRGFIMGIYATVLAIGFTAGPLLLSLAGTTGWMPYLAGTALFALAGAPLYAARTHLPALDQEPAHPIGVYLFALPLATSAAFGFGASETGGFALLPVLGVRVGLTPEAAALLVSVVALGNVVSQVPIGLLADRVSKPAVILVMAAIGLVGALAIPFASEQGPFPLYGLLFVWGGAIGGLYTVGLAYLAARYQGSELAGANAAFVILYNVGLMVGPPIVGIGLDFASGVGFALTMALFFGVILLAGLIRR